MGVNALNRDTADTVSAVWYEKKNITAAGVASKGKHIKVKFIEKQSRKLSQPIKNLMTSENALLVATRFNYDYRQFDELYILGVRWQIIDQQIEYVGGQSNAIVNPRMQSITYLAITQLGDNKLWKAN